MVLSDDTKTALKSTYERAIWLLPCCGLHPLTGVSGESAAQMPYRLSRRGAQQLLSPSGRPGTTLLLQEGRRCGLATSAADHAPHALVCLPIASRTDDEGIRRPRRLSPSCRYVHALGGGQIARSTRYSRCVNEPTAVRRWQKSRRIYVRPRPGPQSAHLWWPAVAKLQAASVPIA